MEQKINETTLVENFPRIDPVRLVILGISTIAFAVILYSLAGKIMSGIEGPFKIIGIIIPVGILLFSMYSIYTYIAGKIKLTTKALVFSGGGTNKRIELDQIEDIDAQGVVYRGLIKALLYNVLYGNYQLVIELKDGKQEYYPKTSGGLFPNGFRKVKIEALINAVKEQQKKIN